MLKYKDKVEDWSERIDEALKFRKRYGREDRWFTAESQYENLPGSGAQFGPNVIFEMGDSLVSRLSVGNPIVGVSPSVRDPRSVDTYPIIQAVDNWMMEELRIPEITTDLIAHSYLWGRGIAKIGYDSEWGFDEAFDLGTTTHPWGMTLTQFTKKGMRIETGPASPGMPWVMPVFPHDFVVPWGTTYLEWAPWCAHRVFRHIDLIRADVKYSKTQNLQPDRSLEDIVDSYTKVGNRYDRTAKTFGTHGNRGTQKLEYIELWEIHNRITQEILVISSNGVHRKESDALQVDGLPFKSLSLIKHPRSFWGTPPAEYLRFHQAEQYDISLQASKQRRINTLKYLVKEGSMTPAEAEKAISQDVGLIAWMKRNADPSRDFQQVPQGTNYQLFTEAEFSRRNARSALGFSRNQMGEYDASSRRTATEVQQVAIGADERTSLRQNIVARYYKDLFSFLNQVLFTYWKTPRVFQVAPNSWPKFTGEEIRGEYAYKMSFGQDRSRSPEARRVEALQLYQFFRTDPLVDPRALIEYLSRVFNDVEFSQLFVKEQSGASLPLPMPNLQSRA